MSRRPAHRPSAAANPALSASRRPPPTRGVSRSSALAAARPRSAAVVPLPPRSRLSLAGGGLLNACRLPARCSRDVARFAVHHQARHTGITHAPDHPSWQKAEAYRMAGDIVPIFRETFARLAFTQQLPGGRACSARPG